MPRQREPIDLVLAKGKKHLTKAEIEERRNSEIKVPHDKVKAPEYLDKSQKKQFDEISKQLIDLGIMTNLDCDALARYLIALDLYLEVTKKINEVSKLEIENKIEVFSKLSKIQDIYFKQCRATASDLGLTITSRCRLVIPKAPEPKKNKFDKFI